MLLKIGLIPLDRQLERTLRKRILTGQLKASDHFSSERELRELFGISTITIRRALKILESDRLIRREQGRGDFITQRDHHKLLIEWSGSVYDFFNPTDQHKPAITSKNIIRADSQTAMEISLLEGEELYCEAPQATWSHAVSYTHLTLPTN